ncbi:MAG TPA: iron-sulfur cluster repair di-iron protein [Terriglobales bacterium]|nr:iron-sulfur cluster repair di-iron protein [Terriglobales bacterium]
MNVDLEKTVRDLAVENPAATRVFEKFGIDYCCGGGKSLREACKAANIAPDALLASLQSANQNKTCNGKKDWSSESLADLIEHIVENHHAYTREEIERLEPLLAKVCSVHGQRHPELLRIRELFAGLAQELTMHMMKEEQVLFPYVSRMEESVLEQQPILPPMFGTVQNPVQMMIHEHDAAGQALHEMRELSASYTPPQDACVSFQTLYRTLDEFERDLHQHIHLENNILFPRAVEMERSH